MQTMFFDHALLPDGLAENVRATVANGRIEAVQANSSPNGCELVRGFAIPGMPNLHCHAFQRGMAGLAEKRGPEHDSFWTWREVMYRFLDLLEPGDVEAIAAFAYMEMLEAGFTAVAEFHYLHHDPQGRPYNNIAELASRCIEAAADVHLGMTMLPSLYGNGGFGGAAPVRGQQRFLHNVEQFLRLVECTRDLITNLPDGAVGIAPHSLRAVTPESLRAVVAATPGGPIHIHVAEQTKEVDECMAWSGCRPVEWLLGNIGLDERWCLIHATHMTPKETSALARTGAVVGLCPITEANLGDGIFECVRFSAGGGCFGIGTDSNIEITASGELKQLEYSQRLKHRGRNLLTTAEGQSTGISLYQAALAGGALACGRRIGAIAPGYRADIVVLDTHSPYLAELPPDRWVDSYVFVGGRQAVRDVYVGGERTVSDGVHFARERISGQYQNVLKRVLGA